jgi:hypothetical protein
MRIDPLKQFAKLQQQLVVEKGQLQARLNEITQVLGNETGLPSITTTTTPAQTEAPTPTLTPQPKRKGRRGAGPRGGNTMSLREAVMQALSKGPLSRKELVGAVQGIGYVFTTKNPANSLGSVLYAKDTPIKSKEGRFYVKGEAGAGSSRGNGLQAAMPQPAKKKRHITAEGRARMAEAAKARWAKVKKAK